MHHRLIAWFAALAFALLPLVARAEPPPPDCSNPRAAADSMLAWLQPDVFDPEKASTCLDVPPDEDPEKLAIRLKQILDARGLYVPISTMPTDPDWANDEGQHVLAPMSEAPYLVLERDDRGNWRYSRNTLEQVDELYRNTFSSLSLWFQNNLPEVFYVHVAGLYLWQFLYAGLLLAISLLIARALHIVLRTWARRLLKHAGLHLNEASFALLAGPVTFLVASLVILWGLPDLQLSIGLSRVMYAIAWLVIGVAGIVTAARTVDVVASVATDRANETESRLDDQVIPLLRQAARVLVFILGVLFILQNYGVDVVSLVAGLGIGGLAFALAAQDTVANLFGSLNIFLDKPFQIGDAVKIGGVEGVVEEVGFRSTRVRTFYNSVVTVPNSTITTTEVDNLGARHQRRVTTSLGLTYSTPPATIDAFVEGVRGILAKQENINPGYQVHFSGFGASSLDIMLHFHVVTRDWSEELATRASIYSDILRMAAEMGVDFAFPSQSLYVETLPNGEQGETMSRAQLAAIAARYGKASDA